MHVSETASEPKADQQLSRQSRDRNHTWRVCSGLTSGFCRHRKFINCVSCQAFHPFPSHMPQCVCPNQFIIQPWNLTHSRDVLQEEFSLLWQSTFCAFLGNILKSNLCICPLCALAMLLGWQKHTKLLLSSCWEWWHKGGHSLPSSFHAGIQIYNKQHQHKFTSVFYVLLYIYKINFAGYHLSLNTLWKQELEAELLSVPQRSLAWLLNSCSLLFRQGAIFLLPAMGTGLGH